MPHKLLITAIAFTSLLIYLHPLLRSKVIAGHDSGYHFTRVQLFSEALKQGQFPVRWTEGPGPGLSHPLFQFYPPLFYYPAAGLMALGIPYVTAVYLTLAAAAITGQPVGLLACSPFNLSQFLHNHHPAAGIKTAIVGLTPSDTPARNPKIIKFRP